MMIPTNIHHKASKRKVSILDQALPSPHIDDTTSSSLDSRPSRLNNPRKQGVSFADVQRQESFLRERSFETLMPYLDSDTGATLITATASLDSITTSTVVAGASPNGSNNSSQKHEGQSPLSSLAVQLILGGLAVVCFIAVFFRCLHVGRQQQLVIESRRRNLAEAQSQAAIHASVLRGTTVRHQQSMAERGTHLVPTSEMTLAARLNMYQARAGIIVSPYPYGQEPYGAAGGGYLGTGPMESVNSFVAPSYEQDVSPPPFMTMSGKPPAYEEAVSAPACAHPPRPIPNRAPATSSAAALTDRSSSPAPFTMIPQEP